MPELSISREGSLDPAARLSVGPDGLTSPRAITRDLWRPDRHHLTDALLRALRQLVGDQPRSSRRATLVEEYGVTALREVYHGPSDEYHYARLAGYALESQLEQFRFFQVTRQLGSSTSIGVASSLADVRDGPVQILAAADGPTPTVVVELTRFRDLKSNQRAAILQHLLNLAAGMDVRLVATPLDQRCLLDAHRDLLPASVIAEAESRQGGPGSVATRTAQRRETARDLLAGRGEGHADWRRLKALYDAPQEAASYDWLEANTLADFPSRDALKQWVRRMREHDLLEAYGSTQARQVRLLPTGYALLEEHPSLSLAGSQGGAGRTDVTERGLGSGQDQPAAVSDPPNTPDSTVYSPPAHEGGEDRPTGEAASAAAGGSDGRSKRSLDAGFLDGFEHDAAVSMAEPGDIALCPRSLDETGDSREGEWSFLEEKDEAVVRVESSGWSALTMTRLCATLLSEPAFHQLLTVDRLAGGPDKSGLDGLPVSNPYVLRSGACFGYLKNADATAANFRRRLRQARNDLLAMTEEIEFGTDPDLDAIGELARKAHGLAGVATRLYDMLGVEITRILEVPTSVVDDEDRRRHFAKMLATQTTVSSRYGVYSAHRVLYEERPDKREQLLGAPDVDAADPVGDIVGSWVLVGSAVDSLRPALEDLENHLVLQTDETNFAPFTLNLNVVDANRRSAYATALARQTRLKSMKSTRQTISLLRAFSSDVFAAAKAVSRLGSEADNPRDLELYDVRSALSFLDPDELLSDLGPRTVSAVVQCLLDVEEPLSTSELATQIGVTTQTIANNDEWFGDLEAAGLLEREDLGPGKATNWRISLPFEAERRSSAAPTPTLSVDTMDSLIDEYQPIDALAECLFNATHRDIDYGSETFFTATTTGGDLGPFLHRHPELRPVLRLVFEVMDVDFESLPLDGLAGTSPDADRQPTDSAGLADPPAALTLGLDPTPDSTQSSLATAD